MTDQNLIGKRALVTGASRGIGRQVALKLAARGASVAINFLNSQTQAIEAAERIAARHEQANLSESQADVMLVKADVSRRDDAFSMIEAVASRWGGLDIVVSNAAAGGFRD